VRFFDRPGLDDGLRISIGTDSAMDALARILGDLVGRPAGARNGGDAWR